MWTEIRLVLFTFSLPLRSASLSTGLSGASETQSQTVSLIWNLFHLIKKDSRADWHIKVGKDGFVVEEGVGYDQEEGLQRFRWFCQSLNCGLSFVMPILGS